MRGQRRLSVMLLISAALFVAILVISRPAHTQASAMVFPRIDHSATLLNNGQVLVTGGTNATAAELYNPATDSWALTGAMRFARSRHLALALADGRVLVLGGNSQATVGELYDPATGRWTPTAEAPLRRDEPGAAQLANGQVLVVGGVPGDAINALYNPATNSWSEAAPNLTGPRPLKPAVLALADGRALVVGGNFQPPYDAELYDPVSDSWTLVPLVLPANGFLTQMLLAPLADGRVLIVGVGPTPLSFLFDPATGQVTPGAALPFRLSNSSVVSLVDGRVLLFGIESNSGSTQVLLYDPALSRWVRGLTPFEPRFGYSVTLLGSNQVLLAGGGDIRQFGTPLSSAILYDPLRTLLDEQLFLPQIRVAYPPPLTTTPFPPPVTPTPFAGPLLVIDDVVLEDPAFPDSEEYVQLRNASNQAVQIAGWQLLNVSRPDNTRPAVPPFVFPSFVLEPNFTIALFSGAGTNDLEIGDFFWIQSEPIFRVGDLVELRSSNGQLVSRFVVPAQ